MLDINILEHNHSAATCSPAAVGAMINDQRSRSVGGSHYINSAPSLASLSCRRTNHTSRSLQSSTTNNGGRYPSRSFFRWLECGCLSALRSSCPPMKSGWACARENCPIFGFSVPSGNMNRYRTTSADEMEVRLITPA